MKVKNLPRKGVFIGENILGIGGKNKPTPPLFCIRGEPKQQSSQPSKRTMFKRQEDVQNCQIRRIYCLTLGLLKMKWLREHAFLGTKDETTIPFPQLGNRIVGAAIVLRKKGGQFRSLAKKGGRPIPKLDLAQQKMT